MTTIQTKERNNAKATTIRAGVKNGRFQLATIEEKEAIVTIETIMKFRPGVITPTISDTAETYLIEDADFDLYLPEANQARIKAGLKVELEQHYPCSYNNPPQEGEQHE